CHHTATTAIYTLSLHDALPILRLPARGHDAGLRPGRELGRAVLPARRPRCARGPDLAGALRDGGTRGAGRGAGSERDRAGLRGRSEEHTSELQSLTNLVCRLLL